MNSTYNDSAAVVSYLEFGAVGLAPPLKKIYDFRTDQQAYDWFMHARYSQDIACYLWMTEALHAGDEARVGRLYREMIHHRDDFSSQLSKWAALHAAKGTPPIFYEHGQTLFGCIEGIEFCDLLLRRAGVSRPQASLSASQVRWEGFDISPFFNLMALRLHENYRVRTHQDLDSIPELVGTAFAKGVTLLYALRTPEDFFTLFDRAEFGLFDISLTPEGDRTLFLGTGKQVHYLSLEAFRARYQASGRTILVRRSPSGLRDEGNRLYLEGVVCRDCEKAERFTRIDRAFRTSLIEGYPELSLELLHRSDPDYLLWSELGNFLDGCLP